MKYKTLLLSVLLTGCAGVSDENTSVAIEMDEMKNSFQTMPMTVERSKYYGDELIKNVNHYAKWLTQDLFANIDFPSNSDVFVVASFALLDSNLNKTSHFGRQMTEAMIHEVHRTGVSVIDVKATDFIRMTESGDVFYESTDYRELSPSADASHAITGTLTKHQGGYLINAKIVLIKTKALVSTAQIFVPHDVVDAVILEGEEAEIAARKAQEVLDKKEREQIAEKKARDEAMPKKTVLPLKAYSQ